MNMTREQIVRIEHLSKVFRVGFWGRRVTAVDDLSLDVQQGEIYGFLGPNGAGKTTTIKMLMGLIYPSSGERHAYLDDQSATRLPRRKSDFFRNHPTSMTTSRVESSCDFTGISLDSLESMLEKRIDELLELVGMTHARDLQLRKFSKGMLQRVGIAQALINDPELVILDEPMSGLDPIGRKEVRDLILRLKESGKTVMFSSHILHDAELLCDRVAMIMKGKLVACGLVSELIDHGTTQEVEMVVDRLSPEGVEQLRPLAIKTVLHGERVVCDLASQQTRG